MRVLNFVRLIKPMKEPSCMAQRGINSELSYRNFYTLQTLCFCKFIKICYNRLNMEKTVAEKRQIKKMPTSRKKTIENLDEKQIEEIE